MAIHWLSEKQINHFWQQKAEYSGAMKEVTIPVSFPYMPDQHEYSATDGSITIDGKRYRKIMYRYSDSQIHLIIVEDYLSENLSQSFEDWVNSMTGADNQTEKSSLIKTMVKEYYQLSQNLLFHPGYHLLDEKHFFYISNYHFLFLDLDTPPPQV